MEITKGLLMHWWHYYGKSYTSAETEKFEKVIDEYGVEKVLDAAIASYVCADGSPTVMLASIRRDSVKEMFESLPDISTCEEKDKELYKAARDEFIHIISQTA